LSESFRSRGSRALHESFGIKNKSRNFLKSPNLDTSERMLTPRSSKKIGNNTLLKVEEAEADNLNSSLNK